MADTPTITLKHRRVAFENSGFRVFDDHIVDSNRVEVENYLAAARHTRREDLITGISVWPVSSNRVVLLWTFRHAVGRIQLEVPRGFVDVDEDPRAAASRELSEETGLHCPLDRLVSLGVCTPEGGTLAARIALFAATDCQPGRNGKEHELGPGGCEYLTFPEAWRMVREMSIEDVTTAIALHRFFLLRGLAAAGPLASISFEALGCKRHCQSEGSCADRPATR